MINLSLVNLLPNQTPFLNRNSEIAFRDFQITEFLETHGKKELNGDSYNHHRYLYEYMLYHDKDKKLYVIFKELTIGYMKPINLIGLNATEEINAINFCEKYHNPFAPFWVII